MSKDTDPTRDLVAVEKQGRVTVLILQREAKRNAFDPALSRALSSALDEYEDDPEQWVAVLTGGTEMFSAGSDLKEGSERTQRGGEYGIIRRNRLKPLIAAAEGLALGGGLEVLFCCDIIVAADNIRLGLPEVSRGTLPTSGALFRALRSLPLHVAKEMVLTGKDLDPRRALEVGLVNHLVAPGSALTVALEIANVVATNSPTSTRESLQAMERILASGDEIGWASTQTALEIVHASHDRKEGISAFFDRRTPKWTGR
ncbi:MAG: enoyl-CoA hydratase [Candidatus Poriferisodalaceae bacterium]|jgi:enoyl-CoA hydratase